MLCCQDEGMFDVLITQQVGWLLHCSVLVGTCRAPQSWPQSVVVYSEQNFKIILQFLLNRKISSS